MIDTREYRNYNNFWYQLLYILRHPIEFIWTFKDNMYNWPDPANTIREYWMKLYIRLPFQKPCRWLGNMLIGRICNSKLLDTFESAEEYNIYYEKKCKQIVDNIQEHYRDFDIKFIEPCTNEYEQKLEEELETVKDELKDLKGAITDIIMKAHNYKSVEEVLTELNRSLGNN